MNNYQVKSILAGHQVTPGRLRGVGGPTVTLPPTPYSGRGGSGPSATTTNNPSVGAAYSFSTSASGQLTGALLAAATVLVIIVYLQTREKQI